MCKVPMEWLSYSFFDFDGAGFHARNMVELDSP